MRAEPCNDPGVLRFGAGLLSLYPFRSTVIFVSFLIAGLLEGISVGSLLPLMSMIQSSGGQTDSLTAEYTKAFFNFFHMEPSIGALLGVITVLIAVKSVFAFFAMRNVGYAAANMANQLRQNFIGAVMGARWGYFSQFSIGKTTNTLITEADRAALSYLSLCKMIADMMLVGIYMVIALFMSWKITLVAFMAGIVAMLALYRLVAIVKKAGRQQTVLLSSLSSLITDALGSVKPIKAMGREMYFGTLLNKDTKGLWRAKRKEVLGQELLNVAREPLVVVFVAFGIYSAYTFADLPFSVLIVLAFMFLRVVQKLTAVQVSYQKVVAQESAYWAVREATDQALAVQELLTEGRTPQLDSAIVFQGVSFSHEREGGEPEAVLSDVSCSFPVNKFHAVIGPSGSGKTTLLDIILGFYKPATGQVLIDGVPLEELDMRQWRMMIGYIPQDSFLLHDTIFNNITLGQEEFGRADVEEALEKAGAMDFIQDLPEELDTMAGERGLLFSGGQRQRIALARALVRKPALLLLDEPTSALDKETENLLMKTLKDLAENMTIITISHSERVKEYADQVCVLDQGRIA